MRTFAIFLLLCLGLNGLAGTVSPTYNFSDFTGYPLNVSRVTITPLAKDAYYSGTNLSARPLIYTKAAYPTLTNGTFTATNLLNGYAYRVEISDSYQTTTITNYFGTNITGAVNAVSYLTPVLGLEQGVVVRAFYEYVSSGSGGSADPNALTNHYTEEAYFASDLSADGSLIANGTLNVNGGKAYFGSSFGNWIDTNGAASLGGAGGFTISSAGAVAAKNFTATDNSAGFFGDGSGLTKLDGTKIIGTLTNATTGNARTASYVTGTLTNSTTGNAATATTATNMPGLFSALTYTPTPTGLAGTDDGPAWQSAWNAAAGATNGTAILDGGGRTYFINTPVNSYLPAPVNRQIKVRNAVFVSTNLASTFYIWSNCAPYAEFEHLSFGTDLGQVPAAMGYNTNMASTGFKSGWQVSAGAYSERMRMKDVVITNFANGLMLQQQDNMVLDGLRVFGCRSNGVYLNQCDQGVMRASYIGFAYGPDGGWGSDFYTGVGHISWLTNCVSINGHRSISFTIENGCSVNYVRQALFWDGHNAEGGGNSTALAIRDSDFEACFAPVGKAVVLLTNGVSLIAENLTQVINGGSNGLFSIEMNNCQVRSSVFINSLQENTRPMRIYPDWDGTSQIATPRIIGSADNFPIYLCSTWNVTNTTVTLSGGNVATRDNFNTWTGVNQFNNQVFALRGNSVGGDMVVGSQYDTSATIGANMVWSLNSYQASGAGAMDNVLTLQDLASTFYYLYLGGDVLGLGRPSPTRLSLFTANSYGGAGVERWRIDTTGSLLPQSTAYNIGTAGATVGSVYATNFSGPATRITALTNGTGAVTANITLTLTNRDGSVYEVAARRIVP